MQQIFASITNYFTETPPQEMIGQIIGIIATLITVCSYQVNTKRMLLITQTSATLCICISYLFLGAAPGFYLNIVCIVRNITFYVLKNGTTANYIAAGVLTAAMGVTGVFSWQGPVSLLIIIALMINTVCLSFGKPQLLRVSVLFTCSMILIYNIFVFSIGGIMNEGLAIVSSIVGIVRYCMSKKNQVENKEASHV